MAKLETLQWRATFTGHLPLNLGALTALSVLKLVHVPTYLLPYGFNGAFPDDLNNLAQLKVFHIENLGLVAPTAMLAPTLQAFVATGSPKFSGYLYYLLNEALDLKVLNCSSSSFYGSLDFIGTLSNLTYINMQKSFLLMAALPSSLWSLEHLEFIDLSYSGVVIKMTPELGRLKKLTYLCLADMNLIGPIPEEIGLLESLRFLDISGVPLDPQPIPHALGLLKNLTTMILSNAYFTGTIPASIGNATNLKVINLGSNLLNGTIPWSIYALPHLTDLTLSNNLFHGQIGEFFAKLEFVDLSQNLFAGTIPHSIATSTLHLDLSRNLLGPSISFNAFANNTNRPLIILSENSFDCPLFSSPTGANIIAHHNKFYGDIPDDYCFGATLDLSFNALHGSLDRLLPSCSFTDVNLRNNGFNGTLPSLERNLALVNLDISYNHLEGPLPAFSPLLQVFDGSYNRFAGPISDDFGHSLLESTSITKVDLGWNELQCPKTLFISSFFYTPLKHLHLSNNFLSCQLQQYNERSNSRINLVGLDLSHNLLYGRFHAASYPFLVSLKLMFNTFDGPFLSGLHLMPAITGTFPPAFVQFFGHEKGYKVNLSDS